MPELVDFAHLPLDIHISVLCYLEPSEIIGLRKTCKSLWLATQERTIWLKAVDTMCADNGVYADSFPLHQMTLIELENAAMAPFKWESFVKKSDPSHPQPSHHLSGRTFVLPCEPSNELRQQRYVYLIPGGRFLLFLENKELMLWELGYPYGTGDIKLLAQKNIECLSITSHASPNGLFIRVFILRLTPDSSALHCEMLQIDPYDPEHEFVTIATHITASPYDLAFTSVCGDVVAFVFGPIIKIWDINTNKCAALNTQREPLQILMNANYIVLVHYRTCTVWKIPELTQWADPDSWINPSLFTTDGTSEPLKVLPYEHESLDSMVECYGLCDWYTGSPQPLWFDIQKTDGGTVGPTSHRFIADVDGPSPDNFSIRPMPSVQIPRTCFNEFMEPYRVCGNHLVAPWRTSQSYHCHSQDIRPRDAMNTEERLDKVVNLFHKDTSEHHWSGWASYSLCPVAGRLIIARSRSNDIQVVDLFAPNSTHDADSAHEFFHHKHVV